MESHLAGRMDEAGGFTWVHDDHLGSASAATRPDGTVIWREHYTPFGDLITNPVANRDEAEFTGHIRDQATGLTYAQARYYNPVTARFLAPDPVGFSSGGPGYFNRYAYTMNDPVNYSDAHGTCVGPALVPCVAFGARVAYAGYRAYRATRAARQARRALPIPPPPIVTTEAGEGGERSGAPPLPEGIVGEGPRPTKGRINSGPLLPEHGGTGNAEEDFENLTGGIGEENEDSGRDPGTLVGGNGIELRPGRPATGSRPATGPRIDIPETEDKPRETLHYPPKQ
jgi:RHS repeat-associated protein